MNQFLEMDIFFFATTLVVVIIGVLLVFILIRILKILGYFESISRDISEESALLREDIAQLRHNIRDEGFKIRHLFTFFRSARKRFGAKRVK